MPQVEALTLDKSYRELSIHKTTYILLKTITGLNNMYKVSLGKPLLDKSPYHEKNSKKLCEHHSLLFTDKLTVVNKQLWIGATILMFTERWISYSALTSWLGCMPC